MCRDMELKVTQWLRSPHGVASMSSVSLDPPNGGPQAIGLFHNEDSEAQRGLVAHPGSHSPDKTLPGDLCPLPVLGDGSQTPGLRFPNGGHGRRRVQIRAYEPAGLGASASSPLYWEELGVLGSWVTWDFKTYRVKAPRPLPGPRVSAQCCYRSQDAAFPPWPHPLRPWGVTQRRQTPLAQEFGEDIERQSFRLDIREESVPSLSRKKPKTTQTLLFPSCLVVSPWT